MTSSAPRRRPLQFSERTSWDRSETEVAATMREVRTAGRRLLDLTLSNPAAVGLSPSGPETLAALTDPKGLAYDPDPRGLRSAREAIARYYEGHGAAITPEELILTASTSEAYSHLFRLLCNGGDEVLVARPSYPLFDYLAELADVKLVFYPLFYDHGWWIDMAELERRITPRTRAIVVVQPNNPTGHGTGPEERAALQQLANQHGLALIIDEVFLDYSFDDTQPLESFANAGNVPRTGLMFVLSGLSKIAALPQMKVGWLAVLGEPDLQAEALARLEILSDTFLSVSTPSQLALPLWLSEAATTQRRILERARCNLERLRRADQTVMAMDGGWSAVVQLWRVFVTDDAATALRRYGVLAHPGQFYGLCNPAQVVVSLLTPPEVMAEAIGRIQEMEAEAG